MPDSLAQTWFPVLLQTVLAMVIGVALVALTFVIGRRLKNKVKDMPYECGIAPTGDAQHRFSVRFYLVAMMFILFDIEAIFLYPWAVVFKQLKMFGFLEMLTFVILILAGFFFIWKKGVLDWAKSEPAPARAATIHLDLTPAPASASASSRAGKAELTPQ
jgi:NADH-quinone oxidoreductase subunit A